MNPRRRTEGIRPSRGWVPPHLAHHGWLNMPWAARAGFVAAAILWALVGARSDAWAGTVQGETRCSVNGSLLCEFAAVFRAAAGEGNLVEVTGDPNVEFVIRDLGAPLVAGRGCVQVNEHEARCPVADPREVHPFFEPGKDKLIVAAEVHGGDRDDTIVTTVGGVIRGEVGSDTLVAAGISRGAGLAGGAGDDMLRGSAARDVLYGDEGDDALSGGGGDDLLQGGLGDDLLLGGPGNDVLSGDSGAVRVGAGSDRLLGGPGNDLLSGNAGDDLLRGGPGIDQFEGGRGNDRLEAIDGRIENVRCGRGRRDVAAADRRDRLIDCEKRSAARRRTR